MATGQYLADPLPGAVIQEQQRARRGLIDHSGLLQDGHCRARQGKRELPAIGVRDCTPGSRGQHAYGLAEPSFEERLAISLDDDPAMQELQDLAFVLEGEHIIGAQGLGDVASECLK
jgi:hypothetical protein